MNKTRLFVISTFILSALILIGSLIYTKTNLFKPKTESQADRSVNQSINESIASTPPVVCKRFTNLEEALKNIEIACVLDLSKQGLTELPKDIAKLIKLNELSLKGNKLTSFPQPLLEMPTIISLDLSGNQINKFPDDLDQLTNLQILKLSGNNFPESEKARILKLFPKAEF